MLKRSVQLITESHPNFPTLDTSISRVILDKVSQESMPETLRLYTPPEVVAFGPLDTISRGYRASIIEAQNKGFAESNSENDIDFRNFQATDEMKAARESALRKMEN